MNLSQHRALEVYNRQQFKFQWPLFSFWTGYFGLIILALLILFGGSS